MRFVPMLLVLLLTACGSLIPAGHQTVAPARLSGGNFRLDPEHQALLFKLDHLGFSTFVGRFHTVAASLDFDPARPEATRLEALIDIASINTGIAAFDGVLAGPDWFDAARFPQAHFVSESVEVLGPGTGRMQGQLTLHGVTRPMTLEITFRGGADNFLTGRYTLGFAATGQFNRSDYGLGSYAPAVSDAVTLEIHGEFQKL